MPQMSNYSWFGVMIIMWLVIFVFKSDQYNWVNKPSNFNTNKTNLNMYKKW